MPSIFNKPNVSEADRVHPHGINN